MHPYPIRAKSILSLQHREGHWLVHKSCPGFCSEVVKVGEGRGRRLFFRKMLHDFGELDRATESFEARREALSRNGTLMQSYGALQEHRKDLRQKYAAEGPVVRERLDRLVRPFRVSLGAMALFFAAGCLLPGPAPLPLVAGFVISAAFSARYIFGLFDIFQLNRTAAKAGLALLPKQESA